MPGVRVIPMRPETRAGKTVLTVKAESPATQLSASLFAHDTVAVAWLAGLQLRPTDDPHVWVTTWKQDPRLPLLLEVGNVTIGPPTLGSIAPGPIRWVFLKPDGGDGIWISDERAQTERERLE
jgi:hypothetical protein